VTAKLFVSRFTLPLVKDTPEPLIPVPAASTRVNVLAPALKLATRNTPLTAVTLLPITVDEMTSLSAIVWVLPFGFVQVTEDTVNTAGFAVETAVTVSGAVNTTLLG
jgi:hypothetical protein